MRSTEYFNGESCRVIEVTGMPSRPWSMLDRIAFQPPLSLFVMCRTSRIPGPALRVACQSPEMSCAYKVLANSIATPTAMVLSIIFLMGNLHFSGVIRLSGLVVGASAVAKIILVAVICSYGRDAREKEPFIIKRHRS